MPPLTHLERVAAAVSHREADRVPFVLSVTLLGAKHLGLAPKAYFGRAEHVVEGRSLMPFLRGESPAEWRGHAISELDWTFRGARRRLGLPTGQHRAFMIRDARWKYVHWTSGLPPMLWDLEADPDEFHDRGTDPSLEPVRARMREALWDWASRLKCRTTITWAEAEFRTDRHKAAGVYFGE